MTEEVRDFFLFVGAADSESATTRLRASGAIYRKKLLSSRQENWQEIVSMIVAPQNRGTLVVLNAANYCSICSADYADVARDMLDSLAGRPHVIFVHEAVFLTDEQRKASESLGVNRAALVGVDPRFTDDYFGMSQEEFFAKVPDDVRQRVNAMLRERDLDVVPYKTNVERSVIASAFLEDNERHLLFRLYVPTGRLYAQEAESLIGLFREWLGQTGRNGIRQEGYSTNAGQVFEFFSAEGEPEGGLRRYFADFSTFLDTCISTPGSAAEQLVAYGVEGGAATVIVSRFATRARRLSLDLKQRREERILSLKHHFENVILEVEGAAGDALDAILHEMLPPERIGALIEASNTSPNLPLTVNNFSPQFINQVTGPVMQNVTGTVNLGPQAQQLLELISAHGGQSRSQLETAVHEFEDEGARGADRLAARARLKRFLADLGNKGIGVGLELLAKYVEHKTGIS